MTIGKRLVNRRRLSLVGVAAVTLGGITWAAAGEPATGAIVAVAVGLLLAGANLAVDVAGHFRTPAPAAAPADLADELAKEVGDEWSPEAAARGLQDRALLPLSWSETRRPVTAEAVPAGDGDVRVVYRKLDGRLEEEFTPTVRALAAGFHALDPKRLVLLGEPGAGKSVLAMLLTIGLLGAREPGDPVPVLLSVSSWDPSAEGLDRWLVGSIAAAYYRGSPDTPRTLLRDELLIPILDGLDEIAEASRRGVIDAINRGLGGRRPIVVTCRSKDYEELILAGSTVLTNAVAVEVDPVPPEDLRRYLDRKDWPEGTTWARVLDHPTPAVAAALSTPLYVSLATLVYQELPRLKPVELLDPDRFGTRNEVEDHLSNLAVPAAYAKDGRPERSRRHLAFLARYLHDHQEREFSWWLLADRAMPAWALPVLAVVAGAVVTLAMARGIAWLDADAVPAPWNVLTPCAVGLIFALMVITVWFLGSGRTPQRLSFGLQNWSARARRGFRIGVLTVALPAVPILLAVAVAVVVGGSWSLYWVGVLMESAGAAAGAALVCGSALAVQRWLDGGQDGASSVDPSGAMRQDRRSALVSAGAAGLVVTVLTIPVLIAGAFVGRTVSDLITVRAGYPGTADPVQQLSAARTDITGQFGSFPMVVAGLAILPGLLVAVLVLLSHAWPRYKIVSLVLAFVDALPANLTAFLEDAQRRGVLRRVGANYQFRHGRLQDRLLNDGAGAAEARAVRTPRVRLRPVGVAAVAVVLLAAAAAASPQDTAVRRLAGSYSDGPYDIVFNDTGTFAALCGIRDRHIYTFDASTGERVRTYDIEKPFVGCADAIFSPAGDALFAEFAEDDEPWKFDSSAGTNTGRLWSFPGGSSLRDFQVADDSEDDYTEAPGVWFASGGPAIGIGDPEGDRSPLEIWNYATRTTVFDGTGEDAPSAEVSTDRSTLVTYGPRVTTVGPASGGPPLYTESTDRRLNVSPDGRWVVTADDTDISLVNLTTRKKTFVLHGWPEVGPLFAKLGTRMVIATRGSGSDESVADDAVAVVRLDGEPQVLATRPAPGVRDVEISADGSLVAVSEENGVLEVFRDDGSPVARRRVPEDLRLAGFGRTNLFLAGTVTVDSDTTAQVWPIDATRPGYALRNISSINEDALAHFTTTLMGDDSIAKAHLVDVFTGRDRGVRTEVAGEVVLGNWADRVLTLRGKGFEGVLVDASTGATLGEPIEVEAGPVEAGEHFAVSRADGSIRLYSAASGSCAAELNGHAGVVTRLVYERKRQVLASSADDGTARLWDLSDISRLPRC